MSARTSLRLAWLLAMPFARQATPRSPYPLSKPAVAGCFLAYAGGNAASAIEAVRREPGCSMRVIEGLLEAVVSEERRR